MLGIYATNLINNNIEVNCNTLSNKTRFYNYCFGRNVIDKYENDKIFYEDDNYIIIFDGVVINTETLYQRYNVKNMSSLAIVSFEAKGEDFISEFEGSFSCIFFLKKTMKLLAFSDKLSSHPLFYYYSSGNFIVASDFDFIVKILIDNNIPYGLNEKYCYFMLTYSFMPDKTTAIMEISRLVMGEKCIIDSNVCCVKNYYKLKSDKYNLTKASVKEMVDELDSRFKEGLKLCIDKDKEYGYKTVLELSGGMDSRLTAFVLKELGVEKLLTICYSKSDDEDATISEKIASQLGYEYILKTLDDKKFMYDIDGNLDSTFGLYYYLGASHAFDMCKNLQFKDKGMIINGILGDVGEGSYIFQIDSNANLGNYKHKKPTKICAAANMQLANKVNLEHLNRYDNEELYVMSSRGMLGILTNEMVKHNFTEGFTPYGFTSYLEYAMSIPPYYRTKENIYLYWVKMKYSQCLKYKYHGIYLTHPINNFIKKIFTKGPKKLLRMIGIKGKEKISPKGQNPFDWWYDTDSHLKNYIDNSFSNLLKNNKINQNLASDLILNFNGNVVAKAQCITVVKTIEKYFGENND